MEINSSSPQLETILVARLSRKQEIEEVDTFQKQLLALQTLKESFQLFDTRKLRGRFGISREFPIG
ncbi:hypothetical protein MTR_0024s0310 [Medicago truncatula]|uniref:Uncharacterized protein n=1 Tax=Medicago truncatula TaxID=3880 RepID=A0A072TUU8_MEDTR|nr:hypothetical protein MTR_0024s0310 [Medicago truncatula]